MKTFITAIMVTILVVWVGLTPVLAQRGPRGPRTDAAGLRTLPGRVLAVNPRAQTAQLALYFLAPNSDAPGKVPDEMAQMAAKMKAYADQLRQQGKGPAADKLMEHVRKLLCWRELGYTVTDWAQLPIFGMRATSLDQIAKGDRVLLTIEVEGNPPPDAVPARGPLAKDIEQLPAQAEDNIKRMLNPTSKRRVYFEISGEVVDTKPLTVRAEGNTIRIDAPDRFRYIRRVQLSPRDVRPGNRVRALVQVGPGPEIRAVRQLNMLADNAEIDWGAEDGGV